MNKDIFEFLKYNFGSKIQLQSANFLPATPLLSTDYHVHDDLMHFCLVIDGAGRCVVEDKEYFLAKGNVHCVFPGERHLYQADKNTPYKVYFLHLECRERIEGIPRQSELSYEAFQRLDCLAAELCRLSSLKTALNRDMRIFGMLAEFLGSFIESEHSKSNIDSRIFYHKVEKIFSESEPPFAFPGVNVLARRLGMSRRSFTSHFRESFGESPAKYYLKLRMNYARNLLKSGEFRQKEVAMLCGYANSQNFMRAYKSFYKF
jgi:AraC-like DNA-binding protein/mannose-6-phosphate isomerase-like protein (cupin superfamily)